MCTFEERGGDRRFLEKLEQIATLHSKKQADYGVGEDPFANIRASQEFGVPPWVGAVIRLNDKVTRLKAFIQKGELRNESVADSLLDISVYALIALILFEEGAEEKIAEHDTAEVEAFNRIFGDILHLDPDTLLSLVAKRLEREGEKLVAARVRTPEFRAAFLEEIERAKEARQNPQGKQR